MFTSCPGPTNLPVAVILGDQTDTEYLVYSYERLKKVKTTTVKNTLRKLAILRKIEVS